VVNAVIDALHRGGYTKISHIDMPVSPSRVWTAMNA
jgi:aerobic carbon-monoxide dehydrogenase large subunit